MAGLRQHGQVGPEIVHLELDLVDLDHRGVDVDVDRLLDVLRIHDRVVRQVRVPRLRVPRFRSCHLAVPPWTRVAGWKSFEGVYPREGANNALAPGFRGMA
jgi:hypothetical protein